MAQTTPNYTNVTSEQSPFITAPLIRKYGDENVVWPIAMIENNRLAFYLYEKSIKSDLNKMNDNRPESGSSLQGYFIDYTANPRSVVPENKDIIELINAEYNCSYDCTIRSQRFSSVDLDYVWKANNQWKALELTTYWMPLTNEAEALRLCSMLRRRPSWQGAAGERGIRKQIEAASDLGLQYFMAIVNTTKVSNEIITNGNAFCFPLTNENVDRILRQEAPQNSMFGTFTDFINWL